MITIRLRNSLLIVFCLCVFSSAHAELSTTDIDAGTFSLISFNLYNRPVLRAERTEASVGVLKHLAPDIIALQEVSQGWFLGDNPVDDINHALGYHRQDFYYEDVPPFWQNGLSVLSRWPIQVIENIQFDTNRFFNIKGFQHVRVEAPTGTVDLINLHMAATQRHSIKGPEFKQLHDYIETLDSPVIVLGDFNERRNSQFIPELSEKFSDLENLYKVIDIGEQSTHFSYGEGQCSSPEGTRVDYLFYDRTRYGLKSGEILRPKVDPQLSDHCLILARLQLKTN